MAGAPKLRVELATAEGKVLGSVELKGFSPGWAKYSGNFRASGTEPKARLQVHLDGEGAVDLDTVSLFPRHTWKNRPGGLRADMVQILADLKPGFMRFPGGCIVEGHYLTNRYQWKNTIGNGSDPISSQSWKNSKKPNPNVWK